MLDCLDNRVQPRGVTSRFFANFCEEPIMFFDSPPVVRPWTLVRVSWPH